MTTHEEDARKEGRLYVVATPIGNLSDISARALEILRAADVVYAEDTRTTGHLLAHHGIQGRLRSLHEHNEREAALALIETLRAGLSVALVSDAGTPAISDPGAAAVAAVRAAGFAVVPVPGASALTAALSVAGVSGPFAFAGFLPARPAARRAALEAWRTFPHALVLYEAPHRILECVDDLAAVLGADRELTVARELTKLHEQTHQCRLGAARAWLEADANRQRGEFVLVVHAPAAAPDASREQDERVLRALLAELPLSKAVQLAATITGARRNALYDLALQWTREGTK
jgi:16S rRNA (cytidine1402-2'-O)-methyltransferase